MSITPAFKRQRQEDHEFEALLDYKETMSKTNKQKSTNKNQNTHTHSEILEYIKIHSLLGVGDSHLFRRQR
jgi:uncharacterized protein YgfB (UPF0149 family)